MGSNSSVATVISNIAARFTEQSQLDALKKFNAEHGSDFGSSASVLSASETTVTDNLKWAENKLVHFRNYLALRNGSVVIGAFNFLILLLLALVTLLR